MPHIIVEVHSQEYNVYYRPMKRRLDALQSKWFLRAGTHSQLDFGGCALSTSLILLLKHTLGNIMCTLKPLDRGHKATN